MKELSDRAHSIRKKIIEVGFNSNQSAHYGGALSMVEIMTSLYFDIMDHDHLQPNKLCRDRFILSKGHGVLAYIATLYEAKYLNKEQAYTFQTNGSKFIAHPVKNLDYGIETSSGSLGQGLPFAVGIAEALMRKKIQNRVYVLCGDGECNEGSIWESAMLAKSRKLKNLTVIVDKNNYQNDGSTIDVSGSLNLFDIFKAFGFETYEIDGHDLKAISKTIRRDEVNLPKAIICNTTKGKGFRLMENNNDGHHNKITKSMLDSGDFELNEY